MAGLSMLAMFLFNAHVLGDGDTYWHLAAGQWMLDHGQAPHTDSFSFTRAGAPWQAHEWLSEVVMALAFRAGGWTGVLVLYGLATVALTTLLTAHLRRWLAPLSLALTLVLTLSCIAPSLLARPHALILPIVAAWMAEMLAARTHRRAPRAIAAVLMLVWANLHGSYVFGFLILAPLALEALIEAAPAERWLVLRDWGLFTALCIAAAALTPQGAMGLLFPFKLMAMTSLASIAEWRPSDFTEIGPFEISLLATMFVCLSRGVKIAPLRLLLLLLLLHMALQHGRHVMLLAVVAAFILAEPLGQALGAPDPQAGRATGAGVWLIVAASAMLLIGARVVLRPSIRPDDRATPAAALDHVPAALRAQPVFNDYDLGGYLIFRGVKPFIDGRADLYGDAFVDNYIRIAGSDARALDATLKRYDIAWTILRTGEPAVALMDGRPGWRRLYGDQFAVVHVRLAPLAAHP